MFRHDGIPSKSKKKESLSHSMYTLTIGSAAKKRTAASKQLTETENAKQSPHVSSQRISFPPDANDEQK